MSKKLYTLITGGSQGLGRALAEECAQRGMNLLLVALLDSGLEETAEGIRAKFGVEVDWLGIDLTEKEAPQEVFDWCQKNHYTVNILINNAAMAGTTIFSRSPLEYSNLRILLNVRALTLLTRLFVPEMKKLNKAFVANIGSMAGFSGIPFKTVYSASKAFVIEFTKALRYELKDSPIQFTVICPSGIRSNQAAEKRIEAHGFIGKWTELSMERISRISVDQLLKGRLLVIPGFVNKIIFYVGRLVPRNFALKLLTREFKKELIPKKIENFKEERYNRGEKKAV